MGISSPPKPMLTAGLTESLSGPISFSFDRTCSFFALHSRTLRMRAAGAMFGGDKVLLAEQQLR